ncbi:nitrate reductase molybdenum cofactor assembly chaperone [Acidovorax sp. GBBC 3334]|uniref:nitrate reductase molybdenum cofactor assembly chaperone n=1 Tax=Acidovorax sp. GBBC 3334 TaxID=2940496 RepID=UPI002303D554|nr:nitrate reductase molybdenum cofactor assembly chaperone [Acidovorax sp. GBBC 3334]MDA8455590.1 nitrate reductase molybdenum cofactor assembly chaperone [Acidovorax sp. GBBC 3334]
MGTTTSDPCTGQAAPAAVRGRHPGSATLRILAALLDYPGSALRRHLAELPGLLAADAVLAAPRRAQLGRLLDLLSQGDPLDAETAYVELFDRGRATSLHLFEHVHGDSRDRGPAMIDLGETYARAGLLLREDELPDYLPAVLEFVSTQPPREARSFLGEIAHLLAAIHGALVQRGSAQAAPYAQAYAAVFAALLELAGHPVPDVPAPHAATPAEPGLDESWTEPAAFDGCSNLGQARAGQPQPIRIVRAGPAHAGGASQGAKP